jgi:hypothetical protein
MSVRLMTTSTCGCCGAREGGGSDNAESSHVITFRYVPQLLSWLRTPLNSCRVLYFKLLSPQGEPMSCLARSLVPLSLSQSLSPYVLFPDAPHR